MTRAGGLLLFALLLAGCSGVPQLSESSPVMPRSAAGRTPQSGYPTAQPQLASRRSRCARPTANSQAGDFDFYLLTLSWSPEFCATHPGSSECASHPGFVVHGLWPQNDDGSYPQHCSDATGPANPEQYLDVIPTVALIQHEWTTHGTCSGLGPDQYFGAIRNAFRQLKIPATFVSGNLPPTLPPEDIIDQFAAANPGWPRGSIALSCGKNYLTAVEVCLTKTLQGERCQNVHTCGATIVKITGR